MYNDIYNPLGINYPMCFNFRGVHISRGFAIFAFLNSQLLGAVVLKYSRIYGWSPYTIISIDFIYVVYKIYDTIYDKIYNKRQLQRCKTCCTHCWIRLKMSSYRMESCIRGFHIYKEVWTLFIGERPGCAREKSNREDPFAVAMKRGTETVGHVPPTISCVRTLFLWQRGPISCEATGSSRPSVSLAS